MKSGLFTFLLVGILGFSPFSVFSQNLTGIWRGYFITESGENYRLEFQVQEAKSQMVTGVSYSYLDTRFYGKATMTGNYTVRNNSFTIQELRTVEVRNMGGGATCLMNYKFSYAKSGREEFLEGTYVGKKEDRQNPAHNGKWGDCGGGTVFLRRVTTSDFYVEPFLRDKITPKADSAVVLSNPPTVKKPPVAPAQTQHHSASKTIARVSPKKPVRTTVKKREQKLVIKPEPGPDTSHRNKFQPLVLEKSMESPKISIPAVTRSRKNELTQSLTVTSSEIKIRIYDNGEIDDDTISVYLDGQLILANKRLSATPITYTLKMDEHSPEHTLVMVAENMGRIPPNTSLMIVQDGDKRYQVSITSTEQKNAMIRFHYQPPE